MDTIYHLSSGSMHCGVAVIRVSGPQVKESWKRLTKNRLMPDHRLAITLRLYHPETGGVLDTSIACFFKGPASYTGEDTMEYYVHGGRAVIEAVMRVIGDTPHHRLAEPGEFTKRGFLNGRIDLTNAEAIHDLIEAETEAQRLQAIDQHLGGLKKLYDEWTDRLTKILAHQEAEIEFPDEDIPKGLSPVLLGEIEFLLGDIKNHLDDNRRGERLRSGAHIAIIGAPNAGKSSLLNALAQRDVAIVSEEAGTTRDIVEVHLNLAGYPVILSDTAGLRETESSVEKEGIRRARERAESADFKIILFDGTQKSSDAETLKMVDDKAVIVITKKDLTPDSKIDLKIEAARVFHLSAKTGEDMEPFLEYLSAIIRKSFDAGVSHGPVITRARHREALMEASAALERCVSTTQPELAAEDARLALRALGRITGKVGVEDILDVVFKDFCIGK